MRRLIDITGQRFGRWTVIERVSSNKLGKSQWLCKCDCGKKGKVGSSQLRAGKSKSCGCSRTVNLPYGDASFNAVYQQYKRQARKWGGLKLTVEQFRELTKQRCHFCGVEPSRKVKSVDRVYICNGVDRRDSSMGYVMGNCLPCCKHCNTAKSDRTEKEFIAWVKKVYHNYAKNKRLVQLAKKETK